MSGMQNVARQIPRRPGLSATVIVMLAIGIGATTAIFSLFHQVLVQPLPVPEPQRLVNITDPGASIGVRFSYPMFRDLETRQTALTGIAAYNDFDVSLASRGAAISGIAVAVSGSYFETLGLQPALGRLIGRPDEQRSDESPVVVLSHQYWQRQFGGDPSVVGQTLTVSGQPLTVVGIAPAGFTGTTRGQRPHVFVPVAMYPRLRPMAPNTNESRGYYWLALFGRLAPAVDVEQASIAINTVYRRILDEVDAPLVSGNEQAQQQLRQQRLTLESWRRGNGGEFPDGEGPLTLLLGVTLLVLAIVCVNIANLLLAHGASRSNEMAIRESLGASRGRLVAQLLTETAALAAIGGLLSAPVAALTLGAITSMLPADLAAGLQPRLSVAAGLFAACAAIATALLFGLYPALRTSRTQPALAMKGQAAQTLGGRNTERLRGTLATAQVALSMVLLVLAGLFTQSLLNVARIDLGLDVESLVSFRVAPRLNGYTQERTNEIFERIEAELAAQPGVAAVATAAVPLIAGDRMYTMVSIPGSEPTGEPVLPGIPANFVAGNVVGSSFAVLPAARAGRQPRRARVLRPHGHRSRHAAANSAACGRADRSDAARHQPRHDAPAGAGKHLPRPSRHVSVGGLCDSRNAARGDRAVRRARLQRHATHARARATPRARRRAHESAVNGVEAGRLDNVARHLARARGSARFRPRGRSAAVRLIEPRSCGARRCGGHSRLRRAGRKLPAGPPRIVDRADGSAAVRIGNSRDLRRGTTNRPSPTGFGFLPV